MKRRIANRIYQTNPYINEVGTNVFWRTQLGSLQDVEILEVLPITLTHGQLSYKVRNGQDVAPSTARHDDLFLPMGNNFQDPQGFYIKDPIDGRHAALEGIAVPAGIFYLEQRFFHARADRQGGSSVIMAGFKRSVSSSR